MKSSTTQLPHNDEEITEQTLLAFMNLMKQELEVPEPPSMPPDLFGEGDPYIDLFGEGVCENLEALKRRESIKKEEVAEEDEEMKPEKPEEPERPTQKTEPAMKESSGAKEAGAREAGARNPVDHIKTP